MEDVNMDENNRGKMGTIIDNTMIVILFVVVAVFTFIVFSGFISNLIGKNDKAEESISCLPLIYCNCISSK